MLAQVHFPLSLSGEELDRYLADGWFRMGQSIFVTNFLNFKQQFYSAIWLRLRLKHCVDDASEIRFERLNAKFNVVIQNAVIDEEKEELFTRYRQSVSFEPSSSVHALLFGRAAHNVYTTLEITVRDNGKLIACGFFDLGKNSTAGISSFYDPAYKKYSLGKFLIYQKISYSRKAGYEFFYPGYFVPGYSPFDYKLKIHPGAQEFFDLTTAQWFAIDTFDPFRKPITVMSDKLAELHHALGKAGIASTVLFYDFYDANLVPDLSHMELFDFPVFLQCFDLFENVINSLIVYDVRDRQFHWMIVKSVWKSDQQPQSPNAYSEHLLKVEAEVIATNSAEEMSLILVHAIQAKVFSQKLD